MRGDGGLPKKGFLSRTRTLPPAWMTLCAALNPDNPPPTTVSFDTGMTTDDDF